VGTVTYDANRVSGNANPHQDTSIGVRHIPMTVPMLGEITRYEKVLKKFPPKIVIGFAGN
jgi:arylsulfatase